MNIDRRAFLPRFISTLLFLCALPAMVEAASNTLPEEQTVVVQFPGTSSEQVAAAIRASPYEIDQDEVTKVPSSDDRVLRFLRRTVVNALVETGSALSSCPSSVRSVPQLTKDAESALIYVMREEAGKLLQEGMRSYFCKDELVTDRELGRLLFLSGVLRLYNDQPEGGLFDDALLVWPDIPFPAEYGDKVQRAFDKAQDRKSLQSQDAQARIQRRLQGTFSTKRIDRATRRPLEDLVKSGEHPCLLLVMGGDALYVPAEGELRIIRLSTPATASTQAKPASGSASTLAKPASGSASTQAKPASGTASTQAKPTSGSASTQAKPASGSASTSAKPAPVASTTSSETPASDTSEAQSPSDTSEAPATNTGSFKKYLILTIASGAVATIGLLSYAVAASEGYYTDTTDAQVGGLLLTAGGATGVVIFGIKTLRNRPGATVSLSPQFTPDGRGPTWGLQASARF